MSEKTYIYFLECSNCKRINPLKIPLGTLVSKFINENEISVCSFCGCNPLSLIQKEMMKDYR